MHCRALILVIRVKTVAYCARAIQLLGWATLPVLEREAVDLSRDV